MVIETFIIVVGVIIEFTIFMLSIYLVEKIFMED